MGKRKKAAKPQGKKRNEPLATSFACLFCNHENSITVKLDKKVGVGQLSCKVCGQSFQCSVNYLSAAVDVYSEWVDACDSVAKQNGGGDDDDLEEAPSRRLMAGRPSARDEDRDDEDEDGYAGDGIVADDEY